ncbi:hypothetical protein D3C79_487870 [compost metagenome]
MELSDYVALLEKHLQRKAEVELLPLQPGDVLATCADVSTLEQVTGFTPQVSLDEGLGRFIAWFHQYYPRPDQDVARANGQAPVHQRRAV